jgi:hypothetical protein
VRKIIFIPYVYINAIIDEMLAKFDRIQRWISPPQFAQEYERARDQREQGTAEWLFEEPMFSEWLKYSTNDSGGEPSIPGKSVLWVQGMNSHFP